MDDTYPPIYSYLCVSICTIVNLTTNQDQCNNDQTCKTNCKNKVVAELGKYLK